MRRKRIEDLITKIRSELIEGELFDLLAFTSCKPARSLLKEFVREGGHLSDISDKCPALMEAACFQNKSEHGELDRELAFLERRFPGKFWYKPLPDEFDYVWHSENEWLKSRFGRFQCQLTAEQIRSWRTKHGQDWILSIADRLEAEAGFNRHIEDDGHTFARTLFYGTPREWRKRVVEHTRKLDNSLFVAKWLGAEAEYTLLMAEEPLAQWPDAPWATWRDVHNALPFIPGIKSKEEESSCILHYGP